MLEEMLRNKGIKVQRYRLRDSIHRVDYIGVQTRTRGRLKRWSYNVKGPNLLWHIDTNHKLSRWYIIIFGAIDGFSRLPVSLECSSNSKADTILSFFLRAVQTYGLPSGVRSDQDMENVAVADFMIQNRGSERESMITEKSTHNQRVERLWRDVYEGVLGLYYELFSFMEQELIMDPLNECDLAALHFVFIPLINEKLDAWRHAWSKHRLRRAKSSPIGLWVSGQMNCPVENDILPRELEMDGVEGVITNEFVADNRPIFSASTEELLTNDLLNILKHEIPYSNCPSNHGIESFLKAKELISHFLEIQ